MLFSLVSSPTLKVATAAGAAAVAMCSAVIPAHAATVFDVSGTNKFSIFSEFSKGPIAETLGNFSGTIVEDGNNSSASVILDFEMNVFSEDFSFDGFSRRVFAETTTVPDILFDKIFLRDINPRSRLNNGVGTSVALVADRFGKANLFGDISFVTDKPLSNGEKSISPFKMFIEGRSLEGNKFNIRPLSDFSDLAFDSFTRASISQPTITLTPRTDPTAVPTPALLPGLIGMGVAAFRKRKEA